MARRDEGWVIEVDPLGACDVLRSGRTMAYDLDDEVEALDFIRAHRQGGRGLPVTVIEADGYPSKVRS